MTDSPNPTRRTVIVAGAATLAAGAAIGKTENVSIWGVRVPESIYRSVEADKRDDGIVQRNVMGMKQFGFLDVDWAMPVLGGAVTKW